ncbi:amidohydrolase [Pseudactinotalea sp. HY158]|uniref:amidohydrolase family protein n=1 Tax=Pseudactinotalea sp. HY158 TaxID=2654547 RepID=UPI00129D1AC0|nr:amidohydrolase family protein [Pseudactinotalea sp. HY158]QGH68477.1 amidohydrolase family protein [Pseudactinotalea sp. HY158]
MRTIDAHLHLWDLAGGGYTWITPELGPLHRTIGPAEARAFHEAAGYDGAILVQADDTRADTDAMLAVAAAHDWVLGVVGWVPLTDPEEAAAQLARYAGRPAGGRLVGIRQLIHADPDPGVLDRAAARETLALLAGAGLPLEVPDAFPRHLDQAARVAADLPGLTVVIDHLGKPPAEAGAFAEWAAQLRAAAEQDNVVAKVSGLHHGGRLLPARVLDAAWNVALEAFGPGRLMLGSDWPMPMLGGDAALADDVARRDRLLATLDARDRGSICSGTATRVYGLPTDWT